jgi:hypothetical protein
MQIPSDKSLQKIINLGPPMGLWPTDLDASLRQLVGPL